MLRLEAFRPSLVGRLVGLLVFKTRFVCQTPKHIPACRSGLFILHHIVKWTKITNKYTNKNRLLQLCSWSRGIERWHGYDQICRKFNSFRGKKLDFQKFPQKCVTCDTPNLAIDGMICKLVEEITTSQAVLDLYETPIEVFLQQSCLKVVIHGI